MKLSDMSEFDQKELIKSFINRIILALNAKIDDNELQSIFDLTCDWLINKPFREYEFTNIYNEIVCNYKFYLPFCFASIRTAYERINK